MEEGGNPASRAHNPHTSNHLESRHPDQKPEPEAGKFQLWNLKFKGGPGPGVLVRVWVRLATSKPLKLNNLNKYNLNTRDSKL